MSLKTMLNTELVSCPITATIREVAVLMKQKDVGAVLVTKNGVPQGILTDRDLVVRCMADSASFEHTKAGEVMTKVVQTVNQDEGVYNVAEKMKAAHVRRIPVVDHAGKAVGILSFDDLFQLIGQEISHLVEATQPRITGVGRQAA